MSSTRMEFQQKHFNCGKTDVFCAATVCMDVSRNVSFHNERHASSVLTTLKKIGSFTVFKTFAIFIYYYILKKKNSDKCVCCLF